MSQILIIVHLVVSVALIMIVLLQTGKGADMGAAFGGGSSQTLFGRTAAAIVFMLTSLALAYYSSHRTKGSIMTDSRPPIEEQALPQTGIPAETPSTPAETPGTPAKTE
jgi:preprotein translocase subunit SecG